MKKAGVEGAIGEGACMPSGPTHRGGGRSRPSRTRAARLRLAASRRAPRRGPAGGAAGGRGRRPTRRRCQSPPGRPPMWWGGGRESLRVRPAGGRRGRERGPSPPPRGRFATPGRLGGGWVGGGTGYGGKGGRKGGGEMHLSTRDHTRWQTTPTRFHEQMTPGPPRIPRDDGKHPALGARQMMGCKSRSSGGGMREI